MTDIYRGAAEVWCLIETVDQNVCAIVYAFSKVIEDGRVADSMRKGTGRLVLLYCMPHSSHVHVERLFLHRWWERAWTFQEATLNPNTFLVGDDGHRLPILDALKIAQLAQNAPPHLYGEVIYGRGGAFWDSTSAMTLAMGRSMSLGEAMACVWRRNATLEHDLVYSLLGVVGLQDRLTAAYEKPLTVVLCELFQAAAVNGDFSWIPWSSLIDRREGDVSSAIIPTPHAVLTAPFAVCVGWTNSPGLPSLTDCDPLPLGVKLPIRDYGQVDSLTCPLTLVETVDHLRQSGLLSDEIWDLLFGMSSGLVAELSSMLKHDEIAESLLQDALMLIKQRMLPDADGPRHPTHIPSGIEDSLAYMRHARTAPMAWSHYKLQHLAVVSCPIGTIVVRAEHVPSIRKGARVFALPVEAIKKAGRSARDLVCLSESGDLPVRACATGLLVRRPNIPVDMPWRIAEVV
ncbi:hypothetical protein C2E23DRAFT_826950 [Lenzites betulinus]|nr:hypothetical protein C2E23DRAFT_826950 [Lenzites betulinus]